MIYMKGHPDAPRCGFSALAVKVLQQYGVPFTARNILENSEIKDDVKSFTNQPVDFSGGMLAQFLGHIASNWENFPIGYEKWQKIPNSYKNYVWNNIIKPKLEVNDDGHKDYILKSLAKKWRDNRCHLYSYAQCDPDGTREVNIAKKPPEIPLEQWVAFIDYRANPDTKAKAAQNTRNRMKLTMPHTLGSKSFARLEKEMIINISLLTFFANASHTTLEGSFVNEEARQNHAMLEA